MTQFAEDPRPIYQDVTTMPTPCETAEITFSIPLNHRWVGESWQTWSHDYAGDVYSSNGESSVTITLPEPQCAFYFYVEPTLFNDYEFQAIGYDSDGDGVTTESFIVSGSAGAAYVGFCGDGLTSIEIINTDGQAGGFAIGEFAMACSCDATFGACCDPIVGECTDDVEAVDCVGYPYQWSYDTRCDDLLPPCGYTLPCLHYIEMWDDDGDGWNDGYLDVFVAGELTLSGITLYEWYGPETVEFSAFHGSDITCVWTPGWETDGCYFCIRDGSGVEIACHTLGDQSAVFTVTGACPSPPTGCCFADGGCEHLTSESCIAAGGTPLPFAEPCLGDADDNGIDDACQDEPCESSVPTSSWVRYTSAAWDQIPSGALVGVDIDLDCHADTSLVMSGPVIVARSSPLDDSLSYPGLRAVDGRRDVIDTQILYMNLQHGDLALLAGAGLGHAGGLAPSWGAIAEDSTDGRVADSFFDVYFELDVGDGRFLYNYDPLRVHAPDGIVCVPPDATYIYHAGCLPLYDDADNGTHVANLVSADHDLYPTPEPCCVLDETCVMLLPADCLALGGLLQEPGSLCTTPAACCLPDGSCIMVDPLCCDDLGGWPCEDGGSCLGDLDNNGIDDACQDEPCEDGGPGPHWVDNTTAGWDQMPSGALVGVDLDLDCHADTSLIMYGPVTVERSDARDDSARYAGLRPIDGHFDVIDTQLLHMNLQQSGLTLTAGAGLGHGAGLAPSWGAIAEYPTDPTLAESFFDVYFELDIGGGQFLYNHDPLRVQVPDGIICVPPDATYIHPTGCLPLYDDPENGTHVANLVAADHDLYPTSGACCLVDGTCKVVSDLECAAMGGMPAGPDTECLGDADGNGVDDLCQDEPCEDGGPGFHWIDDTLAGWDQVASAALMGIDLDLDCHADTSLVAHGPVTVSRSTARDDSAQFPGLRPVDNHFDVIDTQILYMNLSADGISLVAGEGFGQGGILAPSLGAIAEDPDNPALAHSFFDVFFEIDLGGGVFAYNQDPLRVTVPEMIICVPPDSSYIHPRGCLPLYDSPAGGTLVANLVSAAHDLFPRETACCFCETLCQEMLPAECAERGGISLPDTPCTPDPCNYTQIDPPPDVDKPIPVEPDDSSCWLATAANMLAGAGYGNGTTVQQRAANIYAQLQDKPATSGWPDTAVNWWLMSTHNVWPDNPYKSVTFYGHRTHTPWDNAEAARFFANELRHAQLVGLLISWPTGDPYHYGGAGCHALTAWGDNGSQAPLTSAPDCIHVTDSDRDDFGDDVQTFFYDDPNNPNPGGPDEGFGWYIDYSSRHPFIMGGLTLCPTEHPTDQRRTQKTVASYRIHQDYTILATHLHYTVGADVDILTHRTSLSWATALPPTITQDTSPPRELAVAWDLSEHPVPFCNWVTMTTEFVVPTRSTMSYDDVHFIYGTEGAGPDFPDFRCQVFTPTLADLDAPDICGGFLVGAFDLYSDASGLDLIAQYRFQHEYRYDQDPELHALLLESTDTDPYYVRAVRVGHTYGLLSDIALWDFADWMTEDTAVVEMYPGVVYTLFVDWNGQLPHPPGSDYHDCNGNNEPDDLDIASGYSLDLDGNGIPDECDTHLCAGDMNCDGVVNYSDFDPFLAAMDCVDGDPSCWPPPGIPATCPWLNGDCDDDGDVTYADLSLFVTLIGVACP